MGVLELSSNTPMKEREHLEVVVVDGRLILKLIFKK